MKDFLEKLNLEPVTERELLAMSPLKLAYLGDTVYEQYIRMYVVKSCGGKVNELNRMTVRYVNAGAQSHAVKNMVDFLTEDEWAIVKWGRNQKSISTPKNAKISDYKYATGFETLIGRLYLTESIERMEEIIAMAIRKIEVLLEDRN